MRLAKDLVGKPVITISDGQVIGEVKDVCLTPDQTAMAGAFLGKKGLVKRKQIVIPASAVVLFGIDVILVNNAEAVTDSKALTDAKDWTLLNAVIGREVQTTGGTQIGRVGDVVFDEMGSIKAFALSKIQVEGPIKESGIITRASVISIGDKKEPITINMEIAERPLDDTGSAIAPVELIDEELDAVETETIEAELDTIFDPEADTVVDSLIEIDATTDVTEISEESTDLLGGESAVDILGDLIDLDEPESDDTTKNDKA